MKFSAYFLFLLVLPQALLQSQVKLSESRAFNVERYIIDLEINDSTDLIRGNTSVIVRINTPVEEIALDLAIKDTGGRGIIVDSVLNNGNATSYVHRGNSLILPSKDAGSGETEYTVFYHGKPGKGFIIADNIYGERTFFTDNWPNRAHNWFPCVDHPSEKACVDFIITAPSHYKVVANGLLKKKVSLSRSRTSHYWSSSIPVPVSEMQLAAAGFAVKYSGDLDGIPYSTLVFPQNMENGFNDFTTTPDILAFFKDLFGPYPFEKIANIQSPTKYPALFAQVIEPSRETYIAGGHFDELAMVHEMGRNWFGKSVTGSDWSHLWLSEGISTYLTDIYADKHYGSEKFKERLTSHRHRIIDYSRTRLAPVVDPHIDQIADLFNPNNSQKAAWVLHMLEKKTGREVLLEILQKFYNAYSLNNATTDDILLLAEEVAGIRLDEFADDWLYSAGHPQISLSSRYNNGKFMMELTQMQQHKMAFTFPVDIKLVFAEGTDKIYSFDIMFRRHEFMLDLPSEPLEIIIDPDVKLLFEQM